MSRTSATVPRARRRRHGSRYRTWDRERRTHPIRTHPPTRSRRYTFTSSSPWTGRRSLDHSLSTAGKRPAPTLEPPANPRRAESPPAWTARVGDPLCGRRLVPIPANAAGRPSRRIRRLHRGWGAVRQRSAGSRRGIRRCSDQRRPWCRHRTTRRCRPASKMSLLPSGPTTTIGRPASTDVKW